MQDKHQRTEQPTPQKMRKARQEGRYPTSREFVAAVQFFVFVVIIVSLAPRWLSHLRAMFSQLLSQATNTSLSIVSFPNAIRQSVAPVAMPLFLTASAVFFSGLLAQLAVTGFGVSSARLKIDWNRINPAQRLR